MWVRVCRALALTRRCAQAGLNSTWGVWQMVEGGYTDKNLYGDVGRNKTHEWLTEKGRIHSRWGSEGMGA